MKTIDAAIRRPADDEVDRVTEICAKDLMAVARAEAALAMIELLPVRVGALSEGECRLARLCKHGDEPPLLARARLLLKARRGQEQLDAPTTGERPGVERLISSRREPSAQRPPRGREALGDALDPGEHLGRRVPRADPSVEEWR